MKKNKDKIFYTVTGTDGLDLTCVLREKLITYHKTLSPSYFKERYAKMPPADVRNKELVKKFEKGKIRVDLARDGDTQELVGYCISTISVEKEGEIQSIYIEPEYRKCGIGNEMMKKALHWMEENSINKKILGVGAGNEEVITFYKRYSFYPRTIILEQVEAKVADSFSSPR